MVDNNVLADIRTKYTPVAVYYEDADSVEYVIEDSAIVYRRIDGFLTLALNMKTRQPVGFRLKGFKNFYLRHLKHTQEILERDHFLAVVRIIEKATEVLAKDVFDDDARREAYAQAYQMAKESNATVRVPAAA